MVSIKVLGCMDNSDGTYESANRVYSVHGLAPSIPTACGGGHIPKFLTGEHMSYKVRKLTPRECWRLMGFKDQDFDRARTLNTDSQLTSDTQLYMQAGNAIVKQCLIGIFSQLNIRGVMPWNGYADRAKNEVFITGKIRLIELFAGIGTQAMALRDIGADFERHRVVEIDRFAVDSYNAIHGTGFYPQDITKISGKWLGITDRDAYTYIMTYSFPCTDISLAGRKAGMSRDDWEAGKATRSGLLWEVERLLTECGSNLPDVLVMENVIQVHNGKNREHFEYWKKFLESLGYKNFVQDLNARDYGVPQNRARCFMVSLLTDRDMKYVFPKPMPLTRTVYDMLEPEVDEKYVYRCPKAQELLDLLVRNGTLPEDSSMLDGVKVVDMCVNEPGERKQVANCIKSHYNNGITNFKQEGTCVVIKT